MPTNRITKYTFNGNLDFSSKIMSLDTAKWILSHLSAVNGKTIQFSNDIIDALALDEEGVDLVKLARRRGWNFLMPNSVRNDIQFKTTDGSTTASFKINGTAYNSADNVTVTADSDGWFRYNIPYGTTLTTLIGAFNEKTNIDRVVLGEFLDTSSLTDINRMFRYADGVKWIYFNCKFENPLNMTRTFQVRVAGQLLTIGGIDILSGSVTDNTFLISSQTTNNISANIIEESIDLTYCPLSLASAKVILRALQQVTSETISFSTTTWGYILADDEAIELLETAYANGWSSNEPDIQVVAQSGYDGIVRLNGANKQLTNISGTEVWYGSAGTVTAMDDFLKHRNATGVYNSTSTNIKSVRFGKNINTASCTTMFAAFDCGNSTNTLFTKMDVRHLNTSSVTNFQATFADMANSKKTIIGIEDWNVSSGTNFRYLFNAIYLGDVTIDLHKWHISSSADILSMLGSLSQMSSYGQNTKFYYTPGYWGKDPMNDSNIAADRIKPTVYPYHDITIASTSSFNGNVRINETNIATTKDNNLGIWYYDIPSQGELTQINLSYGSSSKAYITSISIGDRFANQETNFNTWSAFADCASLRTVSIPEGMNVNLNNTFRGTITTPVLCGVYGFDKIKNQSISGGEFLFRNQSNMYYVDLGPQTFTTYFNYAFYNCTNLRRISNFPGIENTVSATTPMSGCTNLTYIDASGPISKTISFEDCPLNLNSAKVILSALQTVTSETLTFSSTTKTAINGDSEALSLVTAARSKGWTISLS